MKQFLPSSDPCEISDDDFFSSSHYSYCVVNPARRQVPRLTRGEDLVDSDLTVNQEL